MKGTSNMAKPRFYARRNDGSGAGAIFKTKAEADEFVKRRPEYVLESDHEREDNQRAADEEVAEKAAAKSEDKAVKAAENKSRG